MKLLGLGIITVTAGLGFAITDRAVSVSTANSINFPVGCIVPVVVAPGYLPRADLVVENRGHSPIHLSLEARVGSGLKRADFGVVAASDQKILPNALPVGRNVLIAYTGEGQRQILRQPFYVANRGSDTCTRRYAWHVN